MPNTSLKAALAILPALALAACGPRVTPPDPMASFTSQKLDWHTCDQSILGFDLDLSKYVGDRARCADVNVPLDWSNPTRGTASFSLLRVSAEKPAARKGAIFFNPGGPGGDGLAFAVQYGYLWSKASTSSPVGQNLKTLSEQYDLIGFSPRGVGASTRIYCGTNELYAPVNHPASDRSQRNIDAMIRNARLDAAACQKNPITPFINTDATARDLNLARQLLGDEKFNYVGYSYGTWLGAWYAKLFPANTGRILLDGNMGLDGDMAKTFISQPKAFERDFREVALAYVARHNDLYQLGSTREQAYTQFDALSAPLKYAASNVIAHAMYSADLMPSIGETLVGARGLQAILSAHPDADVNAVAAAVQSVKFSDDADLDAAAREQAFGLLGVYDALVHPTPQPAELENSSAAFTAITCNDTPWNTDQNYWTKLSDQMAKDYPLIGGAEAYTSCAYWKNWTVKKPAVPANMPPVMMLQNEYDPATPREGALDGWKSLPGARMVFIDNESQHAAFPYGTECVDLPITKYFLDGTLPKDTFTACQAKPLPGETQVYPVGEDYVKTTGLSVQNVGASAYQSEVGVQEALKGLRDIIERNAVQPGGLRQLPRQ
ncbi:alpha/beta hydrolase [Deinococcus maricopensis]|uniref:TAP domain protein n=1 Tax=Deinococcus maricopensis (strain DSM 21211 / LMG 22137 / NRRL B-23946 / LB-34) TaxID=709986 RepID=E8UA72_DEIML|nr:alpha/beta hydrolase [Deinococcus maricopensis]ADV67961.1 TAP domain protein [Deinococcus maricopensis DSM 21211]